MARTKQTLRKMTRAQPRLLCGCYAHIGSTHKILPQVKIDVHTTILDVTSRTCLTQTFVNPFRDESLNEIRYIFPLYDGVSIVGFTFTVAGRIIKGIVEERQKAKEVYAEAKARGLTASLLEQSLGAADIFSIIIGNVPAGEKIKVEITWLSELKHDAEVDGLRFTIPTHIIPRYGDDSVLKPNLNGYRVQEEGLSVTIDVEMPIEASIKSIQSSSHPIAVSIGATSTAPSAELSLSKASATLSQESTSLDHDFILHVVANTLGEPAAFMETHPVIPNQRALMATLVPKFNLPAEKPEIVFLCDRSGSMQFKIGDAVRALNVFLKSLPIGVKFNICSFGTSHDFLWPKSKTYNQESLDEAVRHVNAFEADYGGTRMYKPMEDIFRQRYGDMNLEVFLLTDGAIDAQQQLIELINKEVTKSNNSIRIFTLGVGSGASTSLIEGVARAGKGFAQAVQDSENIDKKVVRMLKGALLPHIHDYSLEIKYEKTHGEDADPDAFDFEIIEKVVDSLCIDYFGGQDEEMKLLRAEQPISLFDHQFDEDNTEQKDAVGTKYDHLPTIATPRYLQTPSEIPALLPFNRTTIYIILSNYILDQKPKSVLLKGTCKSGPLELEIPIIDLPQKSTTIHQLAARKEIKELEEGRGWLVGAKNPDGKLLKAEFEGRFSDMVEREAVRLGVQFQVGGKWTSFVAVEKTANESKSDSDEGMEDFEALYTEVRGQTVVAHRSRASASDRQSSRSGGLATPMGSFGSPLGGIGRVLPPGTTSSERFAMSARSMPRPMASFQQHGGTIPSTSMSRSLSGPDQPPRYPTRGRLAKANQEATAAKTMPLTAGRVIDPLVVSASGWKSARMSNPVTLNAFSDAGIENSALSQALCPQRIQLASKAERRSVPVINPIRRQLASKAARKSAPDTSPPRRQLASKAARKSAPDINPPRRQLSSKAARKSVPDINPGNRNPSPKAARRSLRLEVNRSTPLQTIIALQTFAGNWVWNADLEKVLGIAHATILNVQLPTIIANSAVKDDILATGCAILYLKTKLSQEKETWEILVKKANDWLEERIGSHLKELEEAIANLV
ncbi:hypothetical protein G7Z17_g1733 [Cylindrodendrum hubeiense]|uniref:Uncharacterized protein n=1 Tax=Cylindrodendrum hubeiense TaxID=595255 RepID=A0A9P5HJ25_9HYPO|nr:hypothetical protein G7Z17_g1733 [Cylindrodendrum hubeiense]